MGLKHWFLRKLRAAVGTQAIIDTLSAQISAQFAEVKAHVDHKVGTLGAELTVFLSRSHRELLGIEGRKISVLTEKPVAYDSPDHMIPWGTMRDNSVNPMFNTKLARWIPLGHLSVLDLGCAGGGFVKSVFDMGCLAVGIEGSDYSKVRGRAEWSTIPDHLFTADITEPFQVLISTEGQSDQPLQFSVITAWEVIEHIHRSKLSAVFANIHKHLKKNGAVIMSVSPNTEIIQDVALHQTVENQEWWIAECDRHGFVNHPRLREYFGEDWVRGGVNAQNSFHLTLTRAGEEPLFVDRLPVRYGT